MSQAGQQPLVLMVEDDALIALDMCDALARGGFRIIGPLGTNAEASAWMEHGTPDVAILGTTPEDGRMTDLACALRLRGVPTLIHAASGSVASRLAALKGMTWLSKPAWHRDIVDTASAMAFQVARVETVS